MIVHSLPAVHFATACLQNIPPFAVNDTDRATHTDIQALVKAASFSCEGRVSSWRTCFADDPTVVRYTVQFQVWRPTDNDCYKLVGSNSLPPLSPETDTPVDVQATCVTFQVPLEQQITFQPQDVLGFHITVDGESSANQGGLLLTRHGNDDIILFHDANEALNPEEMYCITTRYPGSAVYIGSPFLSAFIGEYKIIVVLNSIYIRKS